MNNQMEIRELQNTLTQVKGSLDRLKSRRKMTQEGVSKLERSTDILRPTQQRRWEEDQVLGNWGDSNSSDIHVLGVLGEERECGQRKYLKNLISGRGSEGKPGGEGANLIHECLNKPLAAVSTGSSAPQRTCRGNV